MQRIPLLGFDQCNAVPGGQFKIVILLMRQVYGQGAAFEGILGNAVHAFRDGDLLQGDAVRESSFPNLFYTTKALFPVNNRLSTSGDPKGVHPEDENGEEKFRAKTVPHKKTKQRNARRK